MTHKFFFIGEKIVSNFARLVVVVWLFVVLVLSSSYTASLSSRLTVKRLQPTVTNIEELIKNRDYIGHEIGSFVPNLLKGIGFPESMLKPYEFPHEFDEALSKGSKNGGISAFYVSALHTKFFLSRYCNKYMIVGPAHQTNGFSFVFQKGSCLVADISRAIINITEGDKIQEIERKWFGNRTCTGPDSTITSTSVTLESFEGLFSITGVVTALCLISYVIIYLYKNKDHLQRIANSSTTTWSAIWAICRHFDQRDLSSYPFRRNIVAQDQFPEVNDIGSSSYFNNSPNLSRNSHSSGGISRLEEEERDANETIHSNLENV